MKKPSRYIVSLLLTVIYILINLTPLASLALLSPTVAHAVTGECSGNCDICGCSAERRANHTCCCCLKKQKQERERQGIPNCCKNKKRHKMTMLTCNCPCGSNKLPGLLSVENTEQLPYRYTQGEIALAEDTLFSSHKKRLTDRHGSPPDPPPKLANLS